MRKMMMGVVVMGAAAALAWTVLYSPKGASCASFTVVNTAATRMADAALIKQKSKQNVAADDIGLVLEQAPWRLVWGTPNDAERGVFFFKQTDNKSYQLVDIWGGVIAPEDRAGAIDWASQLKGGGPSPALAECFVDAVAGGQ